MFAYTKFFSIYHFLSSICTSSTCPHEALSASAEQFPKEQWQTKSVAAASTHKTGETVAIIEYNNQVRQLNSSYYRPVSQPTQHNWTHACMRLWATMLETWSRSGHRPHRDNHKRSLCCSIYSQDRWDSRYNRIHNNQSSVIALCVTHGLSLVWNCKLIQHQ